MNDHDDLDDLDELSAVLAGWERLIWLGGLDLAGMLVIEQGGGYLA